MKNELKINDILSSSNSKFKILGLKGRYYLAEQRIDDKVCAYEVGMLIKSTGKFSVRDYSLPSPSQFGQGKYDKTFPTRMKQEALDHFNSIEL
jgi:hypothetical protein